MSADAGLFLTLDLPALLAGAIAGVACALVGCFLVLRRMSLMGDAISHAVLPGLVVAMLLSGSVGGVPMLLGAIVVGVLTTSLIELAHRYGRLEPGAAMGVVFTALFALGVILLEQAAGRNVHLDADCVLYGQMEDVTWLNPPASLGALFRAESWAYFPRELVTLGGALGLTVLFVTLFYKELKITSFDPALADTLGVRSGLMRHLLMTVTAVVAVASFEAVGSILVVAMIVVPAMIAHLLTDRLPMMLVLSVLIALVGAIVGYVGGALAPGWIGLGSSLSASGMIGVTLGAMLGLAALFAPRHGLLRRATRARTMRRRMAEEDALAALFRATERGTPPEPLPHAVARALVARREAAMADGALRLTPLGAERARALVRSHRLWERFFVDRVGLRADHVHGPAERLEHVTDEPMARELSDEAGAPATDPHGRPIP